MAKQSEFRQWVRDLWLQNCDEHSNYNELPLSQQEYWTRYKFWLKREFKHQRNKRE
jgi:hypothetical protein